MAQITIEVPDHLLHTLEPLQGQLSELIVGWLSRAEIVPASTTTIAYQEVLDFLMSRPTAADILEFKVSESAQNRLRELLDSHKNSFLVDSELAELNNFEQIDQLMRRLKICSYKVVNQPVKSIHD
jgi:hypothetical protein